MADNPPPSRRKKPVSQKRVAVVLTSLVAALTLCASLLLLMEGLPLNSAPSMLSSSSPYVSLDTEVPLQGGAWQYIIVYESGPMAVDAAGLAEGRYPGGSGLTSATRRGARFHFVVEPARALDGGLKVGLAWLRQECGAPYAGWPDVRYHHYSPYNNAVGVCVAADLSRPVGGVQSRTVSDLLRQLQQRLGIPASRVVFQWELEPHDASSISSHHKVFADYIRKTLD